MRKEIEEVLDKNLSDILEKNIHVPEEFTDAILKVQYKKEQHLILLNRVAIFIFGIIITIGITGVAAYQHFLQKNNTINYHENLEKNYYENIENLFEMTNEELFYKIILNYEEYIDYTSKFNGIIEMSNGDFEDNFLIIVVSSWKYPNLIISNITSDDNTMYVEVDSMNKDVSKDNSYMISSMISKNLYRDNLSIYKRKEIITSEKYTKLENLPEIYTTKDAEKDNCVVIENSKISYNGKNVLDKFINNTQKGIDDYVRIAIFSKNQSDNNLDILIYDIEFKNNEFIVYQDATRNNFAKIEDILYLGKFKYFNIDYNGTFKILKIGNFENDSLIIGVYGE